MKTKKLNNLVIPFLLVAIFSVVAYAWNKNSTVTNKVAIGITGIKFTEASLEKAIEIAKKENKPLFIMIHATWCPTCKKMKKSVLPEEELGNFYNKNFINVLVNFDEEDGKMLRKQYNVHGTPTFLYMTSDGSILNQTSGFQTKEELIAAAKNLKVEEKMVCN